jgi:alpha-tubulin suppressor-like RCC1 family protein
VGLTADGRVLFTGVLHRSAAHSSDGKTEENYRLTSTSISSWREIVALTAGPEHIVAMNREGAVLAMGLDEDGQCSATAHYTLFRDPRQLYGYGKYRLVTDDTAYQTDAVAPDAAKADSDQPLIPFARFSAHLRADTERLLKRLTGTEDRLTVLTEDGSPVTYRYESGELLRDALPSPVVSLSCGGNGSFLVCEDGTVRVRGELTRGSPLTLLPDKLGDSPFYRVKAIAGGANHTAVLLTDGTVSSYGENDLDQCDTDDWRDMVAIAVGDGYTVGLRKDGTVEAAGGRKREPGGKNRGRSAQGVAHLPRANPCAVDDWKNVCGISCNGRVTLGLCADGTVKAVGSSHYGQCNTDSWRGVVSVATSGNHTVALFGDGHVEAVGLNESGECRTESWSRVVQIAVMPELTLGLRSDGKVLAAGKHHEVLHTLDTVRAIACFGQNRQVFVMSDGTLRVHRRGSEFLPDPLEGVRAFIPSVADSVLHRYTVHAPVLHTAGNILGSFAVGMAHTLTLGKGGAIIATGAADNGQCDIRAYGTAVQVAAGAYHSAVLLADGRVILSGDDSGGKSDSRALNRELDTVGVDAEESRGSSVPTVVEHDPSLLPYAWRQVACGLNHTAALRSDGRVYAIGQNPDGRCDTRKWRNVTRITCGIRHTVAVTAEGTCVAAGDNRYGQCDTALWKNITMAAAGEYHTVALRADGCVEAAGDNRKGQCRVEDLRNIVSVACLPEATLCVTAEGRVIIRGGSGQHDKAVEALREVVAIHTCEHRIAALTVDRRVILIP